MSDIIPISMTKTFRDGHALIIAGTNIQYAMSIDNINKLLGNFTKEYRKMIEEMSRILNEMKSLKKIDLLMCWRAGDMIYELLHNARKNNLGLTNYERTLARDLEVSPSRISYYLRFRELHPRLEDVNHSIPWSWYIELGQINDKQKLKSIESDIKKGKIKTITELKKLRGLRKNKINS